MRGPLISLLFCTVSGCAVGVPRAPIGASMDQPLETPHPSVAPKPVVPDDVVARAAQSFHAQRNADGQELNQTELFDELSKFYPDFQHLKPLLFAIDLRSMVNLKL